MNPLLSVKAIMQISVSIFFSDYPELVTAAPANRQAHSVVYKLNSQTPNLMEWVACSIPKYKRMKNS